MRRVQLAATLLACACASGSPSGSPSGATAPAPSAAATTSLRYAPGTGRYRLEQQTHSVQEMMGQAQENDASITMVISAALTAEGGNLSAAFTVDSVVLTGPQPSGGVEQARGRTFRAVFTPQGRSVSVTSPDSTNRVLQSMREQFRDFLPVLPVTATAGQAWTDTTSESNDLGEVRLTSRAVRQHRVVGWETLEGVRALRIATASTYAVTGTGSAQGQELTLNGNGSSSSERLVSSTGVFLSQTGRDSSLITVTVVSMGLEVPVRRTSSSRITRLP